MKCIVLVVLLASLAAVPASSLADQSTPDGAIRAFLDAVQRNDFRSAANCVHEADPGADYSRLRSLVKGAGIDFDIKSSRVETGDRVARVFVEVRFTSRDPDMVRESKEEIEMRRVSRDWRIVVPKFAGRDGLVLELARNVLDESERRGGSKPSTDTADERARLSQSNVRELVRATLKWAINHRGRFMEADWKDKIDGDVKPGTFRVPGTRDEYRFNGRLRGVRLTDIDRPGDTILVYDGDDYKLRFRHNGRAVVGLVNGSVRLVTEAEARRLRWAR
jgi:hypothetical protein